MSIQRRTLSLLSCTALILLSACETVSSPLADTDFDEPELVNDQPAQSGDEASEASEASGQPSSASPSSDGPGESATLPSSDPSFDPSAKSSSESNTPESNGSGTVFPGVLPETVEAGGFPEIRSDLEREPSPDASYQNMRHMLSASNDLGLDLVRFIGTDNDDNVAVSPVSIHAAMGLLLSAATDETLAELIAGNGFLKDVTQTHASLSRISMQLAALQEEGSSGMDPVILKMANRIFVNEDGRPKSDYLDILAKYYDTGAYSIDFSGAPEPSREAINQWVMDQTESRIKDLLPKGSIKSLTQWVFVNALYFKAPWGEGSFQEKDTKDVDFRLRNGETVSVPMMKGSHSRAYRGETDSYSWGAVKLGSNGHAVAAFLKPKSGKFDEVFAEISSKEIERSFRSADRCLLSLQVPKVKINTGSQDLIPFYRDRGVKHVFGDFGPAQLDGIGMGTDTKLQTLVHSVFFAMDEKGVEAAASTAGAVNKEDGDGPKRCDSLKLDEPFLFFVYDTRSQLLLFSGRVMDPRA